MNTNKNKTRRIVFLGLCTAVALVLSYLESLIPPIVASVPGIKIGLPNIVSVFLLYRCGTRETAAVSFVRIAIMSLLFGNAFSLAYSAAGALLSIAVMSILKKTDRFSKIGVSVSGGVFHNLGQVLVAIAVLGTAEIGYYMIVLALSGTVAGIFVGVCASLLLSRLKRGVT